jgi:predicted negative regulator of RcsB-dependent stress response
MDIHASEKEQVEALKKWWKDNGSSVITGILLGLSVLLGGKAWFGYQETQALSASNVYTQMMSASGAGDSQQVQAMANQLITKYSNSAYAPLAALLLARQAVEDDQLGAAQSQLQWALDNAKSSEIKHTARVRLARILIDQQKYAEVDKLMASLGDTGPYSYLYTELKGDLALAQGRQAQAAEAYQQALEQMPPQAPNQALLTAKYENVGIDGEAQQ